MYINVGLIENTSRDEQLQAKAQVKNAIEMNTRIGHTGLTNTRPETPQRQN